MDKGDWFYINFDQMPGVEEKKARSLGQYVCVYNRILQSKLQKLLFNRLDTVPGIQKHINWHVA